MSWDRIRAGLGKLGLGALTDEELTAAYNAIASKPMASRTQEDFNIANEYFMRFSGAAPQIAASSGYQVVGQQAVPITTATQTNSGVTAAQAAALLNPSPATGGAEPRAAGASNPASPTPASGANSGAAAAFPLPLPPRTPAAKPAKEATGIEAIISNMPPLVWAVIGLGLVLLTQGSSRR